MNRSWGEIWESMEGHDWRVDVKTSFPEPLPPRRELREELPARGGCGGSYSLSGPPCGGCVDCLIRQTDENDFEIEYTGDTVRFWEIIRRESS